MSRQTNRPIALGALAGARANVGVQEVGENGGPAVTAYLASCVPPLEAGAPWCAAFVRFRMKKTATDLGITYDKTFPRSAYTPDWHRWARQNNKWIGRPFDEEKRALIRPGDLALFYFPALGRIAHIGIIEQIFSWGIVTIEGNTSPEPEDEDEVERDGDGVYRKRRMWSELGQYGGILMVDF